MTESAFKLTLDASDARELMTPNPTMVHEDSPIDEVAELFIQNGFSAAPVVDDENRVIGVISQTDLVRHQARPNHNPALSGQVQRVDGEAPATSSLSFSPVVRVSALMNDAVYVVDETTPALAVIRDMIERGVRRLFVVDGDRVLVGVISAVDVVRRLTPSA